MGKTALAYSVVAYGPTVLAEYSLTDGSFIQTAHPLLQQIDKMRNQKNTFNSGKDTFHYVVSDEITFMCLAVSPNSALSFAFLNDILKKFFGAYGKSVATKTLTSYQMNAEFRDVLKGRMEYFNAHAQNGTKLKEIEAELDDVKGVIQDSIGKVLDRGDMLDDLMEHSDKMVDSSQAFRATSTQLRHKLWWNDMKLKLAALGLLCFVLFLLSAWACGGMSFPDCRF